MCRRLVCNTLTSRLVLFFVAKPYMCCISARCRNSKTKGAMIQHCRLYVVLGGALALRANFALGSPRRDLRLNPSKRP